MDRVDLRGRVKRKRSKKGGGSESHLKSRDHTAPSLNRLLINLPTYLVMTSVSGQGSFLKKRSVSLGNPFS